MNLILIVLVAFAFSAAGIAGGQVVAVPTEVIHCGASTFVDNKKLKLDCRTLAAVEDSARDMVATSQTPGLAIAVLAGDRIILSAGFGLANLEAGSPVTPATVFPIYSVTKAFT